MKKVILQLFFKFQRLSGMQKQKTITMLQRFFSYIAIFSISILLASCTKDECEKQVTRKKQVPVYKSLAKIRASVGTAEKVDLKNPGKIYFRTDDYLFVGEKHKGIHIYDNAEPSNPRNIGYIQIPGNTDMAVKGDIMYANSYTDMYAIDISNPSSPEMLERVDKVFENSSMSEGNTGKLNEDEGVIVDYQTKEVTEKVDCSGNDPRPLDRRELSPQNSAGNTGFDAGSNAPSGIGGSMARFAISGNHLYAVDWSELNVFNLSNGQSPDKIRDKSLQEGIETIFPYKDKLFIGSQRGMFIYDNSNPSNPVEVGRFEHARACDPVYPTDSFAYVTLNSNGPCGRTQNRLDVLNITDISNPQMMKTYSMEDPNGLAVEDQVLYLCDGRAGLKVYSTKDKYRINSNMLDHKEGIHAFDAIPHDEILMVIGNNGLHQYNFSNPENMKKLSHIPATGDSID